MTVRTRSFDRVSLADLRSYLSVNGWVSLRRESARWEVFQLSGTFDHSIELVLPGSDKLVDVEARIETALSVLSQIEERPIETIRAEISRSNTDSLLVKLGVDVIDSDSIPLDDATRHVKALRNLLLYGACSEIEKRMHFEQPLPAAHGILNSFEFCHTFSGSFGFEVSSEVVPSNSSFDLFDVPMCRRIVERVARGLKLLESAVNKDAPEVLVAGFERGFNARMCDALIAMAGVEELSYNVDLVWGGSVSPSEDVCEYQAVSIEDAEISILEFASKELKRVEPHAQVLRGLVVNLHCARDPSDQSARRTVEVKTEHPERGLMMIRMSLGPAFYATAIQAHANGASIEATGQLQRKGNSWTFDGITAFSIAAG